MRSDGTQHDLTDHARFALSVATMHVSVSMGTSSAADEGGRLLLTVVEAAAMLRVGRTKAYELIAGGHLQVVHIGRAARVPLAAVQRYVEALVSPPSRSMRRAPRNRAASQPSLPFAALTND